MIFIPIKYIAANYKYLDCKNTKRVPDAVAYAKNAVGLSIAPKMDHIKTSDKYKQLMNTIIIMYIHNNTFRVLLNEFIYLLFYILNILWGSSGNIILQL